MPFKSEAQRRKFYALAERGEIPWKTVQRWEHATNVSADLPEHLNPCSNRLVPFPAASQHQATSPAQPPTPPQGATSRMGAAPRLAGESHVAARMNSPTARANARYQSAHWGIGAERTFNYPNERDMPDVLVEMGKLVELQLDTTGKTQGNKKAKSDQAIAFPRTVHLAFATTADERLYVVLPAKEKQANMGLLVDDALWFDLADLADLAPGRQTDFTYPRLQVQCLGVVTHVVYATEKEGDGPSEYIHAFGEESGTKPLLAVDGTGGLWFAGGNYSVPDAGITD